MTIYIINNGSVKNVSMRVWDGQQYGPDIFADIDNGTTRRDFPAAGYDTDADAAMTEKDYRDFVAWWTAECSGYNGRTRNNWFVENLDDDTIDAEYSKGQEIYLFAD